MHMGGSSRTRTWQRMGLAVGVLWVVFFAWLLFADDPPDFFWDDIAEVDGPAHFVGGLTTGVIAYLLTARLRRGVFLALALTAAVLLGLELVQDVFTSRRWEASDVLLALLGGLAGVAGAFGIRRLFGRRS